MITEPSTIRPKSIAPTDKRFADSPRTVMTITREGQGEGDGRGDHDGAAQIAEKEPLHQKDQDDARRNMLCSTVWVVTLIKSVRS